MAAMRSGIIPRSLLLLAGMIIFALDAAEALTIANNLKGPLTVLQLPGCCSKCVPHVPPHGSCPGVCVQCPDVVVAEGKAVTLDKHVGPYPLPFLRIQVGTGGGERLYCVTGDYTKHIAAEATLALGPGVCGPVKTGPGLQTYVFHAEKPSQVVPICVPPCYA